MTDKEKKLKAKEFAADWSGKGYEKGETSRFWIDLLDRVFGVPNAANYIEFEKQIKLENGKQGFIDGYIPAVKVLIEQKGSHIDLRKPEKQSDGTFLTPYQQSRRYENEILKDEQPDWIIICNFSEFIIYDMRVDKKNPVLEFKLDELPKEYGNLEFLVDNSVQKIINEVDISIAAGKLVAEMYDALLEGYGDEPSPDDLRSLNILCVRLVFCFYAEDAGVFGGNNMFGKYLDKYRDMPMTMRKMLIELFRILDTPKDERDPYDDPSLLEFPYVNGGLFDKNLKIIYPKFTEKIAEMMIDKASSGFDWSGISPTIFGAVFESTLNPETRRSGGMHYTSIENIHKVIDPLFLDDLKAELSDIDNYKSEKKWVEELHKFHKKLSELTFLDPACGSGNFLTETYLSLRRLENKVIDKLNGEGQLFLDSNNPVVVSIQQFYGIEINDFAVSVAKTALWIAELQMLQETENIIGKSLDFLPLKSYTNITEGNALTLDWEKCAPRDKLNYIMGNPPFVGYSNQTASQKNDMLAVCLDKDEKPLNKAGKIDYVSGWYFKAARFMKNTKIRAAFVSTNSITQGEQVAIIWKNIFEIGTHIDYAYRTFRWDSEAYEKAHVHCVIIGFSSAANDKAKVIYDGDSKIMAQNINGYLVDAPNVFIDSRNKPICNVPEMLKGSIPVDDGNFFLSAEEKTQFLKQEPQSEKFIKKFYGAREFLHNEERWCLWLVNASPSELKAMPKVMQRVKNIKEFRLKSTKAATRKFAETPTRFMEIRQPTTNYIIVPSHSSENREYIPLGFVSQDVICGNANLLIPNAGLYEFGILNSKIHMIWTDLTCGRIKSDFRYSNTIVYNNFPWCDHTSEQKSAIEQTAQTILDARALYPDSSLADLYDETVMPKELRKAHENNDKAVMKAYGFSAKMSEQEIVAELMKMYEELDSKRRE
ncbi:MAG: methylase [Oscillospiraceae bacterium]|nr:methylase [Oscillospiraceae bacterium]